MKTVFSSRTRFVALAIASMFILACTFFSIAVLLSDVSMQNFFVQVQYAGAALLAHIPGYMSHISIANVCLLGMLGFVLSLCMLWVYMYIKKETVMLIWNKVCQIWQRCLGREYMDGMTYVEPGVVVISPSPTPTAAVVSEAIYHIHGGVYVDMDSIETDVDESESHEINV